MKRNSYLYILVVFMIICCVSCNIKEDKEKKANISGVTKQLPVNKEEYIAYTFTATILNTNDVLTISPEEGSNEAKSSDLINVNTSDTVVLGLDGNKISIDKLRVASKISIDYSGEILESYPAQIEAISIIVLEENPQLEAYKAVIDDIYEEDSGLNGNISLIALDLSEITELSETDIKNLLNMVKVEYGLEVIKATYKELVDKGLIDDKNLYFETGILIQLKNPSYNEKKKSLTYGISKWRSGLGAIGTDKGKAKLKDGKWIISKENMWIS